MAGVLMSFPPDGEQRIVPENDIVQAMAKGAMQVNRYALDKTLVEPPPSPAPAHPEEE